MPERSEPAAPPTVPPPPPGERTTRAPFARQAVALLLALNILNYVDRYLLAAVEPMVRKDLFAPDDPHANTRMGLLTTAFMVSYMLAAPLFGLLGDRWKRWWIVALGVAAWSIASGASGLAGTFVALLITRAFVGVGEAAYGPVAPTIIADLYPVEKRGWAISWFYLAIPVGSALGYVFGGQMQAHFGWRWAFYAVAPPGLLLAALCLLQPEPARGAVDGDAHARKRFAWGDYRLLLKNTSFLLNTAAMTAMSFAIGGVAVWMPHYVHEFRSIGVGAEGLASVNLTFGIITVVSGLAGTLAGGWLADRLRARVRGSYFLVSGLGMLAALPLFIATLYAPFPLAWWLMGLAMMLMFINTGPANAAIANVVPARLRSSAYALVILVIHALGDAISPTVIGAVTDATRDPGHPKGNMNTAFLVVSAAIAVSGIVWIIARAHLERDTRAAATS